MVRPTTFVALWLLTVAPALAQREVFTVEGTAVADVFGSMIRSAGDVDDDGMPDFMVSAFDGFGRVTVFSGATQDVLYSFSGTVGGYGRSFDGLGDVNGDGHADFAISEVPSGVVIDLGVVFVHSGATGDVLYTLDAVGADADIFGSVLRSCGDLDDDGRRDLLVQSKRFRNHVQQSVIAYSGVNGSELFRIDGPQVSSTAFADAFAGLGDADGDGVDDFVISDNNFIDNTGKSIVRGRAIVYSGQTQGMLFSVLGNSTTFSFAGALADAGDIDGDGFADLLVGSPTSGSDGMVQVVSGDTGTDLFLVESVFDGDGFGSAVSRAGDVDGDGTEDFLVGAPRDIPFAVSAGSAYVYSGATGEELFHVRGTAINDRVGTSVAPAGDVEGDGRDDVLVGMPFFVTTAQAPGRVHCYAFGNEPVLLDFDFDDDFRTPLENGRAVDSGARFGRLVRITSDGPGHFGAATFDSSRSGPNANGADPDLLVDRGNLLILQEDPTQNTPGIFISPDDAEAGGTLRLELLSPGRPVSLDLVDICPGPQDATVRLTDLEGRTRTYDVPNGFTADGLLEPQLAVRTLSLSTLDPQPGVSATATATEDPDFDAGLVTGIEVMLASSGAVDGVRWVPSGLPPVEQIVPLYSIEAPPGAGFGRSARSVGDVDGDGRDDIVVGQQLDGTTGFGVGRLYSGADGTLLHEFPGEQPLSVFGDAAAGVGDVDGDGVPDVAFGGWLYDVPGGSDGGVVRVYSGQTYQLLLEFFGEAGDRLGVSLDAMGDVDDDGHDDLLVGSSAAGGGRGRIEIRSGTTGVPLLTVEGSTSDGTLGSFVRNAGDFDADGSVDFLAYEEGGGTSQFAGRLVVFSGADGRVLFDRVGTEFLQLLGAGSAPAGDVNDDGHDDVLLGDWGYVGAPGPDTGRLEVISGKDGTVLHEIIGEFPGGLFPIASAAAGDQDGDGAPDFAALEQIDPEGLPPAGTRLRIYSGATGTTLYERILVTPQSSNRLEPGGDLDGDGFAELLVVSSLAGVARVEALTVNRPDAATACIGAPSSTGFGARLLVEGSLRASDNDLRLIAGNLPAGAFVQLSSSPVFGRGAQPFVQGMRTSGALCLGGAVMRHTWTSAGPGATATFVVDLSRLPGAGAAPGSLAGETRFFQCFYRDPGFGGESNFSDALRIRFE
ncbi:MAG: hypothetical protein GY711_31630 [bacterium]|nr:hypothetical protein [bacterium]